MPSSKILVISTFLLTMICSMLPVAVIADHLDPTALTNVNEQTDLFEESTGNWQEWQGQINSGKDAALGDLKKGEGSSPKGLEYIDKNNGQQLKSQTQHLSGIKASDLNHQGSRKLSEENMLEDLYIDYSKPLNRQHKQDAKKLALAQEKLLGDFAGLMAQLKKLNIDCKAVKGAKKVEPSYYLQMQQEKVRNTVYNQTFCEELRNQYNCRDAVTLKCSKTGKRYGDWQDRKIRFNGHLLHNQKMNWGWAVQWKRKRWGWHIHSHHPKGGWLGSPSESPWRNNPAAIIADARGYIAAHLGVPIEQIGEHVGFPVSGRGIGNIGGVGCRWRVVWDEYEFAYKYRDAHAVCAQWSEDWNEQCSLK